MQGRPALRVGRLYVSAVVQQFLRLCQVVENIFFLGLARRLVEFRIRGEDVETSISKAAGADSSSASSSESAFESAFEAFRLDRPTMARRQLACWPEWTGAPVVGMTAMTAQRASNRVL